ncbi:hypothetical protein LPJ66_000434 [Kickxella alabastrina]|uniref:Uncharacterized protein n=1 Tax=Kickxella alabastrina TaxID=61397 RepID=A0ACC1IW38_9FUNG|nr:hypothetical protein LPJ66_000434 [Kickxella alabastrina]
MVKFASALFLASLFGAFASAQPVVAEALAPRNLVIVTVYETVYATAVAAAKPTSSVPAIAAKPTYAITQAAPVAHAAKTTVAAAYTTASKPTYTAPEPTYTAPVSNDWRTDMLAKINAVRASAGKSALILDTTLNTVAQSHSEYENSIHSMTHSDPNGTLGTRLSSRHIAWKGAAENIAWNQQDVASVMSAWTKSSGHYVNMVGDYTHVGFGQAGLYWTQDFYKA